MNRCGKDHCKQNRSIYRENIRGAIRTPSNVERSSHRETISDSFHYNAPRHGRARGDEGLERGGSNAEKHQYVDDEELVVTCHDPVVHHRKGDDRIDFLGNK
jgi:hypothetical protein